MQYNEIEYGRKIKEDGFQGDNIKKDLTILSKYLKHVDNMKLSDHKKFIYKFCEDNIIDFNEVVHFKIIDSCINKGRKRDEFPIQVKSIPIHEEYLRKIDSYDVPDDHKKLMLSLLVHKMINAEKKSQKNKEEYRLDLCHYSSNKADKHIFNSSRIGNTYKTREVIISLNQSGVIHDIGRNRIILKFAEDVDVNKVYYNLQSDDFDKIGWVWDLYKGHKMVIRCSECDKLIKKKAKNSNVKYCQSCAKSLQLEHSRAYKNKIR